MGLDLHALEKRPSFSEDELQKVITKEKDLDQKYTLHWEKFNSFWKQTYGITADEYFEAINGNDEAIEEFFGHPMCKQLRQEVGLSENPKLEEANNGPTSSVVLNYYFNNCNDTHWYDIKLKIDKKLLKNPSDAPWIPYGPHLSVDEDTSISPLLDEYQLLFPDKVEEAIARILKRPNITEKDLRIIAFLKEFPGHIFAFI